MKDWLKLKKYPHFSKPFEPKDIPRIRAYVSNPSKIVQHRFFPFIHYTIVEKRFRRNKSTHFKRDEKRTPKKKCRQIFYADHLDAQIFAYYGYLINQQLQRIYETNPSLNASVIAYRSIEFDKDRNKCNIDFAKEVFDFIKSSSTLKISVLCFDVKSFFDSLDHKVLKRAWCKIFNQTNLDEDHYQVYKAITRFTYVEIGDLIKEFEELKIKKLTYLKNKELASFCKSGREFRDRVQKKRLIHFNKYDPINKCPRHYGIPQGSSISAVLSNLYMLDFDQELTKIANDLGGLYRRYSDDILFICAPQNVNQVKATVQTYLEKELKLKIQNDKTQEVEFSRTNLSAPWACCTIEKGVRIPNQPLSYLGFDFDGHRILLRQKSLSLYYRKMKRMIRRGANYAFWAKLHNQHRGVKPKDAWIFKRKIYRSKSHLGAKKKKIDGKVFWGNYISYAYTASKVMNSPNIRKQVKNHWRIIENTIQRHENRLSLEKMPSRRRKLTILST